MAVMNIATRDMAIEAALAFMALLLLMSLLAIIRLPPAGAAPSAAPAETGARPELALPAQFPDGTLTAIVPRGLDGAQPRRGRYVARHGRRRSGRTPPARPAGPPWGPAESPPGQRR
jgi:hypothetical protein